MSTFSELSPEQQKFVGQLGLDLTKFIIGAIKTRGLSGAELLQMIGDARDENERSVFDALGITRPAPSADTPPDVPADTPPPDTGTAPPPPDTTVPPPAAGKLELEKVLDKAPDPQLLQPDWFVQYNPELSWPDDTIKPAWIIKQRGVGRPERASEGWVDWP